LPALALSYCSDELPGDTQKYRLQQNSAVLRDIKTCKTFTFKKTTYYNVVY
jgi:hypothetical protein